VDGLSEGDSGDPDSVDRAMGTGGAEAAVATAVAVDVGSGVRDPESVFPHQVRLFWAAYRMLGSACEADELVRHALTRSGEDTGGDGLSRHLREVFGAALASLEATGRTRRDGHVGSWLPEPVLTEEGALGPVEARENRESVSMARLVALERLSPPERAAYVLRESFGYGAAETAAVLGLPETRCRVLRRRARHRVSDSAVGGNVAWSQRQQVVAELVRAALHADQDALTELLAEDVVAWSDGGGPLGAARRPVLGAVKVGRFLSGLVARAPGETCGQVAEVNGDVAVVATAGDVVVGVLAPEFGAQGLVGIRMVADPRRLVFIGRQWAVRARG
jgi:hypothetical protein